MWILWDTRETRQNGRFDGLLLSFLHSSHQEEETLHIGTCPDWLSRECAKARSFADLNGVAMRELTKFTEGAELVCGPITTGGLGSVEENLRLFQQVIDALVERRRPVFSQMPYENHIWHLTNVWKEENPGNDDYHTPVLEGFYLPLFETRRIRTTLFLPGWETSKGARWERRTARRLGLEVADLVGWP